MYMLVTLDGSHFSESILATVAKLARPLNAQVELFAVGQPEAAHSTRRHDEYIEMAPVATITGKRLSVPLPTDVIGAPAETRSQAVARIESTLCDYLRGRAKDLEGVDATLRVEMADDPAEAIIARARQVDADLIAMATHGRTGVSHLLAGSVCERVIRSGVAPVLVLRP